MEDEEEEKEVEGGLCKCDNNRTSIRKKVNFHRGDTVLSAEVKERDDGRGGRM